MRALTKHFVCRSLGVAYVVVSVLIYASDVFQTVLAAVNSVN